MSNVEKYANELAEVDEAAKKFIASIQGACGGSFQWGVKEITNSFRSMFDRFCPYEIGDRVQLTRIPLAACDPSSGWYASRHFLIPGSKGKVLERGYHGDTFVFDVVFDDESWIDDKGAFHPIDLEHRHTYHLGEQELVLAEDKK